MPYIDKHRRVELVCQPPATPGELNFEITRLCIDYLVRFGLSYSHINDVVGALECAKLEFYSRVATRYEDKKIAANGDVYPALFVS